MYAFESHGIEPDFVCLGKGLGNGIPVSAVVGRGDIFAGLKYGEGSDTWSANAVACAAVVATLDEFETSGVLEHAQTISRIFFRGLKRLKETPVITKVRGEGMVFGIECGPIGELSANEVANKVIEACYLGKKGGDGIHFLGRAGRLRAPRRALLDNDRGAGRGVLATALRTGVGSRGKITGKSGHRMNPVCH